MGRSFNEREREKSRYIITNHTISRMGGKSPRIKAKQYKLHYPCRNGLHFFFSLRGANPLVSHKIQIDYYDYIRFKLENNNKNLKEKSFSYFVRFIKILKNSNTVKNLYISYII